MTTKVLATGTFDDWYRSALSDGQKHRVLRTVQRLRLFGHNLGRPHADSIRGSSLKELRIPGRRDVLRAVFGFNRAGEAILLLGGDKKGVSEGSQVAWLDEMVRRAERLMLDPRAFAWSPPPPPPQTDDHEDDEPKKHKPPPRRQGPARFSMEDAARERAVRSAEERLLRGNRPAVPQHANPQLSHANYKALVSAGYSGKYLHGMAVPGGFLDPTHPDHQKRVDEMVARAKR